MSTTTTTYVKSLPGSPKNGAYSPHRVNPGRPLLPKPVPQANQLMRSLAQGMQWEDPKKAGAKDPVPSNRRLASYTEDERRVLAVRCYHERHIHRTDDVALSAKLDVAMDELDDLWMPSPRFTGDILG